MSSSSAEQMSIGRRRIQPKPSPESSQQLSSSGNYNSVMKRSTRPLSTGVGQRIKSNAFSKEATWERRRCPIRRDLGFHPQTKDQDEEKKKVAQRCLQGGEWHPQMSSSSAPVNRAGISPATILLTHHSNLAEGAATPNRQWRPEPHHKS
jgi:hypothetical protein